MIEIDNNDSNTIVLVKLSIVLLTMLVMGFSILSTGYKILKQRKREVGFSTTKG